MAIDTQQKRASAMFIGLPFRAPLLVPDGDLDDDADRAQLAYLYSGLDYDGGGSAAAVNDWYITVSPRVRR